MDHRSPGPLTCEAGWQSLSFLSLAYPAIGSDSQAVATFGAASLEHFPSVGGAHALEEAVRRSSLTAVRLVCPFHFSSGVLQEL